MKVFVFALVLLGINRVDARNEVDFGPFQETILRLTGKSDFPVRIEGKVQNLPVFLKMKADQLKREFKFQELEKDKIQQETAKQLEKTNGKCLLEISRLSDPSIRIEISDVEDSGSVGEYRELTVPLTDNSKYEIKSENATSLRVRGSGRLAGVISASESFDFRLEGGVLRVRNEQNTRIAIKARTTEMACVFSVGN